MRPEVRSTCHAGENSVDSAITKNVTTAPLAAYKPVNENELTTPLIKEIYGALNHVDRTLLRSLYRPYHTFHERIGQLTAAYEEVGGRFQREAEQHGLADFVRYAVLSRSFSFRLEASKHDETGGLDELRALYDELERLGHPHYSALIGLRANWVRKLVAFDELEEARAIVNTLITDVQAIRKECPDVHLNDSVDRLIHELEARIGD